MSQHPDLTERELSFLASGSRGDVSAVGYQLEGEVLSNLGYLIRPTAEILHYTPTKSGWTTLREQLEDDVDKMLIPDPRNGAPSA